jgi:hypothetical protein
MKEAPSAEVPLEIMPTYLPALFVYTSVSALSHPCRLNFR